MTVQNDQEHQCLMGFPIRTIAHTCVSDMAALKNCDGCNLRLAICAQGIYLVNRRPM